VSARRADVAFVVLAAFHRPILAPVYELLKRRVPSILSGDLSEIVTAKPRVLVVCDHPGGVLWTRMPDALIVSLRHGFGSKNYFRMSMRWYDFVCVNSAWERDSYLRAGITPRRGFWLTGFVPMDSVFGAVRAPASEPGRRSTLLFAPTWNRELTAATVVQPQWLEALLASLPQLTIRIKPHPHTRHVGGEMVAAWKSLARREPRVQLVEDFDADIYPLLPATDVLVTDCSSVMFFFLAFDRPIVLVNNPLRFARRDHYDPNGPEWTWRDMGDEVETFDQFRVAVTRALAEPQARAAARAVYRQRLFGELTDGRAAERAADELAALFEATGIGLRPRP
jgi:CDP-glycerol glycerophosphotransferase (TagB/SpsB family)